MGENNAEKKIRQRLPLPWAVSLVCFIVLPFGMFLGKFNFPLWVLFIVWAEYFVFGATPSSWKLVFPSIPAGALAAALWMATGVFISQVSGGTVSLFWGLVIGDFIWVTILLYAIPHVSAFSAGTLAVFNGLTLFLAVYFTGSIPKLGPMANPYWVIVSTFIWTTIMAYLGWVIGWLNIVLTFPKEVE